MVAVAVNATWYVPSPADAFGAAKDFAGTPEAQKWLKRFAIGGSAAGAAYLASQALQWGFAGGWYNMAGWQIQCGTGGLGSKYSTGASCTPELVPTGTEPAPYLPAYDYVSMCAYAGPAGGGLDSWFVYSVWQRITPGAAVEKQVVPVGIGTDIPPWPWELIPDRPRVWPNEAGYGTGTGTLSGNPAGTVTGVGALAPGRTYVWSVPLAPGAVLPTAPAVFTPPPSLPKPNDPAKGREKKTRLQVPGGGFVRIFGLATEVCDAVDAVYKAIPLAKRLRDGTTKRLPKSATADRLQGGKFNDPGCVTKAKYIFDNLDAVDGAKALVGIASANASDAVLGGYSNKAAVQFGGVPGSRGGLTIGPAL